MQYLSVSEYISFGLGADTSDELITAASAMIDAFCRRASLAVTQCTERVRLDRWNRSAQLAFTPITAAVGFTSALVRVRARCRRARVESWHPLAESLTPFASAEWIDLDVTKIDVGEDGTFCVAQNLFGMPFDEAEVTYTAGFLDIPTPVKVACAQIARNAQATPALNVKRQGLDRMQMEYFAGTLLDMDVQRLLKPYVSERVG